MKPVIIISLIFSWKRKRDTCVFNIYICVYMFISTCSNIQIVSNMISKRWKVWGFFVKESLLLGLDYWINTFFCTCICLNVLEGTVFFLCSHAHMRTLIYVCKFTFMCCVYLHWPFCEQQFVLAGTEVDSGMWKDSCSKSYSYLLLSFHVATTIPLQFSNTPRLRGCFAQSM